VTTIASNTPRTRLLRRAAFTGVAAMMMLGVAAGSASASTTPAASTLSASAAHAAKSVNAVHAVHTTKKTAPAKPVAHPSPTIRQLMPHGTPGGQSSFTPSSEQIANAKAIVKAGQEMKLSPRAQVIAIACALQESKLKNLGNLGGRNDHDSLGLFQQRPSAGWGTPRQLTTPDYAAKAFYKALKNVSHYETRALTDAVQRVQVSAFPYAYAQWEKMASNLVLASYGTGPYVGH
jgi:hypothetical protein